MANNFQITISAVDRATAVVRKINASMARLTAPVTRLRQSISSLARETGFDKVGKGIVGVVKGTGELTGKLSALAGPLSLLIGGGTLAGIIALTTEWSRMGAEVGRTSEMMDVSYSTMQSLRGAASVVGVGAQELTGGLKSLGDTMEDALYGRNQQALVILNRLGVGIHHTANGSIDAARGVRDLSGAIAGIKNVQVQGVVARAFGLEALLPLLRQGPEAIDAYERKVASLGGVMSNEAVAGAERFQMSLNYLGIATQGVRNAIGERLLPILEPLVQRVTEWIAANRDLIATKVGEFVEGLAHWLNQLDFNEIGRQVREFGGKVEDLVDSMGGWKNAAIALFVFMNGSLIGSVINLGLAVGNLAIVAVPAAIRGFGLMASVVDATLVPAVLKGLLSAGLYTAGLADLAAGIPIVGTLLGGLSAGFLGLGAAIAATPIGWLIAGVAAVAFGVYAIYKNWGSIVGYFSEKIAGVRAAFDEGWINGILKVLWEFNPTKIIADALDGLTKWLFGFSLYDAGKSIVNGLVSGMKWVANLLPKSALKFLGLDEWAKPAIQVSASVTPPAATAAAQIGVPAPGAAAQAAVPASVPARVGAPVGVPPRGAVVQTSAPAASSGAALGLRNNNPGNLRQWGDTPRDAKGYAVFPSIEAGLTATVKNLIAQQQVHGLNSIRGIVSRWAPPSENNTPAYISDVTKKTGFAADQRLNLQDPAVVAPLISAIVKHEGNGSGVSEEMINRAVAAQLGAGPAAGPAGTAKPIEVTLTLHGLPPGVSASAKTSDGKTMPVRVAYSMPTGVTP